MSSDVVGVVAGVAVPGAVSGPLLDAPSFTVDLLRFVPPGLLSFCLCGVEGGCSLLSVFPLACSFCFVRCALLCATRFLYSSKKTGGPSSGLFANITMSIIRSFSYLFLGCIGPWCGTCGGNAYAWPGWSALVSFSIVHPVGMDMSSSICISSSVIIQCVLYPSVSIMQPMMLRLSNL